MQVHRFVATMACAVAMASAAPIARSDAPCDKGYRDSTPAERATMTVVLQAVKNALPPAPTGWVIVGDDQISVLSNLCRDHEIYPWQYGFTRYYQQVDDQDARNKIIADAAAASAAAFAQKQPRLDAVMARMEKLTQTQIAFIEKGDMSHAEAISAEIAKAQEEYQKILDEGDSAQQFAAADVEASRDLLMNIFVRVNSNAEAPSDGAASLPLPPGARAAFRWSATDGKGSQNEALFLLGQWKPRRQGGWQTVYRDGVPVAGAHSISIRISADSSRLAPTVDTIDFKSLAAGPLK